MLVTFVADAGENNADTQSVAARIAAIAPVRHIYGGDVYGNGTTTDGGEALDFTERYDPIFGSTAPVDLRSITLPVMGNHEWRPRGAGFIAYWAAAQGAKGLPTTYPEIARYATVIDGWRFIVVNTEEIGGVDDGGGGIGQGMIWLDQQLDLANGKAIVFGHRPRWSPGDVSEDRGDQDDLGPMWDVLAGRCGAYISGHTHVSAEMPAVGGTRQLLAGAGGAFFNAVDDASAAGAATWSNNTDWAVLQLDTSGNQVIAKWIKASDGSTLRSIVLTAPSVSPPPSPPTPVDLSSLSRAQEVHSGHNSAVNSVTDRIAFPGAPTAGQLLVSWVGIDKDSGTSPVPGQGWEVLEADHSPSVSYGLAWRLADGGANDQPSWSWTTAQWCVCKAMAYDLPADSTASLAGSDAVLQKSAVYEESRVYARSCGTHPLTPAGAGALGVAFCAIDSAEGDGSLEWDNDFEEVAEDDTYLDGGGSAAERIIEDGSPVLPSISGIPGDQAVGAMALFNIVLPDTDPPETYVIAGPPNSTSTDGEVELGADEEDCTFEVKLDSGSWGPASGTPSNGTGTTTCSHEVSGLNVGAHTLYVRATDAAGNTDPAPASWNWEVEEVPPPQTSITSGPDNKTTLGAATFTLEADREDCTFEVRLDAGGWQAASGAPANGSGVTTCEHSETGLTVGNHTLYARATDDAGTDASPASWSWEITVTQPDDTLPDFSWLDEGGAAEGGPPKLALPFRMEHRGAAVVAATVQQDSLTEIAQCVYAVLGTQIGSRPEEPEFGVVDQALIKGGADIDELVDAIDEWEPRADALTESQIHGVVEEVRVTIDAVQ